MRRISTLPVDLPVGGRPVLVVGGGPDAVGPIAVLRDSGAVVTVVAADVAASIADLADRGVLRWERRGLTDEDLDQAWLVYTATGSASTDGEVIDRAAGRGTFALRALGHRSGSDPGGAADRIAAGGTDDRSARGRVLLVGGGPGDPGLLTVRGLAAVRTADVVVHDRLAPLAVLDQVRAGTLVIDVSKIPGGATTPQHEINRLLVEHAAAGRVVVRLKGGDNFVFGRGGEEWQACEQAGIEVELVPGVSSALAVPALAGIPLTHRTANQGFTVITGHVPPGDPRSTLDYQALARSGTALVIMMGVGNLAEIAATLIAEGMDPSTAAATVADGSLPGQRVVKATVADIATATSAAGIRAPAITVIGSVAAFDPSAR